MQSSPHQKKLIEITIPYEKEIKMMDGGRILLLHVESSTSHPALLEPNRNIVRLKADGTLVWQIDPPLGIPHPSVPFKTFEIQDGKVLAYWRDTIYFANPDNGKIVGRKLLPPKKVGE
jgi:hypothetical protein